MNFVFIVFELEDKMLTLSSMENLIVQSNHQVAIGMRGRLFKSFHKESARGGINSSC